MDFNPADPNVMHIDLNSCFATIEQQANPLLRGKPVVVAAYTTDRGCILAASREAKVLGIKTGMRVYEGKSIYPKLIILPSDPPKYRFVNRKLLALLQTYSPDVEVKSIDEMVIKMPNLPRRQAGDKCQMLNIAREIKKRIKKEIGEWLTVSIGIAPNRYLAKIASNLHKPDGLDVICAQNIEHILCSLKLEELTGIKEGLGGRLRRYGITSPIAMYRSGHKVLQAAFASKIGYDWWRMLHGWESDLYNRNEVKTIGHSFALPKPYAPDDPRLMQILCQLVEKMGRRLRADHFLAQGIRVSCVFADHTYWNHAETLPRQVFANPDLYIEALRILKKAPNEKVRLLAVNCFALTHQEQLSLTEPSRSNLTQALDKIADRWGEFSVFPARMLGMENRVLDRIAFGGVR